MSVRRDLVMLLRALAVGAAAAFVDFHTSEVTVTVAVLVVGAAYLGFASRTRFWLWAAIAGAAVPAGYAVAAMVHVQPREWPQPPGATSGVLLAAFTVSVAIAAAAAGASLRRMPGSNRPSPR